MRVILFVVVLGLFLFWAISAFAPFKDSFLSLLYPKRESHAAAALPERTVIDNQGGGYWMYPYQDNWSKYSIYFGHKHFDQFKLMPADALKGPHGRFQHAAMDAQESEAVNAFFPGANFLAYDNEEVAKGNRSLRVTRGGQPVVFDPNRVFNSEPDWQMLDIDDERYIKYFIDRYIREGMSKPWAEIPNMWAGMDNCMFQYGYYGSTAWDSPYPQNSTEFLTAINRFFKRVKEIAPDIKITCNEGHLDFENRYTEYLGDTYGAVWESMEEASPFGFRITWNRMSGPNKSKIQAYQYLSDGTEPSMRRGYMLYTMLAGSNAFYGPKNSSSYEWPRSTYATMENNLGIGLDSYAATGTGDALLYSRETQGGMAYFNFTGASRTITLPTGQTWFNRSGAAVTQLVLANDTGDYVTKVSGNRSARPQINPRSAETLTGPVTVTIDPGTSTGATIRYTLDGSDPTASSPIYSSPLTLSSHTVVKAKTYVSGMVESLPNTATYKITSAQPTVDFHLSNDHNSEYLPAAHPVVRLSNPSATAITVNYSITGGSATRNTDYTLNTTSITLRPREQYTYFPITITNDSAQEGNETIQITLTSANGANLGTYKTYTYTIVDNDSQSIAYPAAVVPNPLSSVTPGPSATPIVTPIPTPIGTPAVTPAPSATNAQLSVTPTTIAPGGTVSVSWSNVSSPTVLDWTALYLPTTPDGSFLADAWIYTSSCSQTQGAVAKSAGSCNFVVPSTVAPGVYHLRLFANDGTSRLATSGALNIASATMAPTAIPTRTAIPTPTTIPSPTVVFLQGDTDQNGKVDIFDYNNVLRDYGKTGTGLLGDTDKNGKVDIFDYNNVLRDYGR